MDPFSGLQGKRQLIHLLLLSVDDEIAKNINVFSKGIRAHEVAAV